MTRKPNGDCGIIESIPFSIHRCDDSAIIFPQAFVYDKSHINKRKVNNRWAFYHTHTLCGSIIIICPFHRFVERKKQQQQQ